MNRPRPPRPARLQAARASCVLALTLALPGWAGAQTASGSPPPANGGKPSPSAAAAPKATSPAKAAPAPATKATAAADKPPAAAVSASRKALQSQAKGLALATEVVESISEAQLEISDRVLTGTARCEFSQSVEVERVSETPGHFRVRFKRASYWMVPEETSTGAVRLVDRKRQVVWLQIPSKSMMMDQGAGRRLVDSCQHAEQRAAAEAADAAAAPSLLGR